VRAAPIVRVLARGVEWNRRLAINENPRVGEMRLLFVRDVGASARFYRDAFGIEVHEGQEIAFEVDDLDEAHARALAAGAHEYVIKPFTAEAMTEKLALLGLVPTGVNR